MQPCYQTNVFSLFILLTEHDTEHPFHNKSLRLKLSHDLNINLTTFEGFEFEFLRILSSTLNIYQNIVSVRHVLVTFPISGDNDVNGDMSKF